MSNHNYLTIERELMNAVTTMAKDNYLIEYGSRSEDPGIYDKGKTSQRESDR